MVRSKMPQTLEQKISAYIELGNALPEVPLDLKNNLNPLLNCVHIKQEPSVVSSIIFLTTDFVKSLLNSFSTWQQEAVNTDYGRSDYLPLQTGLP